MGGTGVAWRSAQTTHTMSIAHIRKEYLSGGLRRKDLHADPFQQFGNWLQHALASEVPEGTAMVLATADKEGHPSSRVMLLKGFDQRGFLFFTNYNSRKGRELAENAKASITFFWPSLERQICIRGAVSRLSPAEAEEYFVTRPIGSRYAAWVSRQSEVIQSRSVLEDRLAEVRREFPVEEVPTPPYWGGFVLSPVTIEFWQGGESRLHDRFRYSRSEDGSWVIDRLSP
jgi:pyridoxamine 5'-phosphate oxidase